MVVSFTYIQNVMLVVSTVTLKFKTRSEVHNCNTVNRDRLHIPLCRTAAGQRAFTFRGQKLWNSLPDEFQSITNLDAFRVKIKQHFLRVFLENYVLDI